MKNVIIGSAIVILLVPSLQAAPETVSALPIEYVKWDSKIGGLKTEDAVSAQSFYTDYGQYITDDIGTSFQLKEGKVMTGKLPISTIDISKFGIVPYKRVTSHVSSVTVLDGSKFQDLVTEKEFVLQDGSREFTYKKPVKKEILWKSIALSGLGTAAILVGWGMGFGPWGVGLNAFSKILSVSSRAATLSPKFRKIRTLVSLFRRKP